MTKISLKELRMLIKSTKDDVNTMERNLRSNAVEITQKVTGAEDFVVSTPFNFEEEFAKLEKLRDKHIRYEILAQEANASIKVEGMSLTEILKKIKGISEKISLYDDLLYKKPYNRRVDVSNSGTFYYEVCELRFDDKKLEKERDALRAELQKLEVALDKANTEPVIEIEM